LQRPRQLFDPVSRDGHAPVFVVLDGADADANCAGDAALRYLTVLADDVKAVSCFCVHESCTFFGVQAPSGRWDETQVAGHNHSKKLSFLA
jgi:hypothetical protein